MSESLKEGNALKHAHLLGRTVLVPVRDDGSCQILAKVVNHGTRWGRSMVQVSPLQGRGLLWTSKFEVVKPDS